MDSPLRQSQISANLPPPFINLLLFVMGDTQAYISDVKCKYDFDKVRTFYLQIDYSRPLKIERTLYLIQGNGVNYNNYNKRSNSRRRFWAQQEAGSPFVDNVDVGSFWL